MFGYVRNTSTVPSSDPVTTRSPVRIKRDGSNGVVPFTPNASIDHGGDWVRSGEIP